MAEWTSTITTLQHEWMRSTTSLRLAVCRSARESAPFPRLFASIQAGEAVIPSSDPFIGFVPLDAAVSSGLISKEEVAAVWERRANRAAAASSSDRPTAECSPPSPETPSAIRRIRDWMAGLRRPKWQRSAGKPS